jgi:hypothetical protein
LLHERQTTRHRANDQLIPSAKRASPAPVAALAGAGQYRVLTGNNTALAIADGL